MKCVECEQIIKKDEGFVPLSGLAKLGLGIHHPSCEKPCRPHQCKVYQHKPEKTLRMQGVEDRGNSLSLSAAEWNLRRKEIERGSVI